MSDVELGKLVWARISYDDKIKSLKKSADVAIAADKEIMSKLDAKCLQILLAQNVDSVRTQFGTVFKDVKHSYTVKDREAFFNWVIENENWHFLPSSVNSTEAAAYVEANGGALPPGVGYSGFTVVKFRRPTKKVN